MYFNILLIPLFFVLMVGDVVGRIKNNNKMVSICQPGTTIVVFLIAMTGFSRAGHPTGYIIAIGSGLLISAIADGLLVDRNDPHGFIKGMALFAIAISIYGITWTVTSGIRADDYMIMFTALAFYGFLLFIFNKGKYTDERKPTEVELIGISIYMFIFCMVIARGIATASGDFFNSVQSGLIIVGSISFFVGDLQLGIYHFINLKFPMKQAPPFYFLGQLCIGLSCILF